jgi:hypothetical protein
MDNLEEYLALHGPGGGSADATSAANTANVADGATTLQDAGKPTLQADAGETTTLRAAEADDATVNAGAIRPANPPGGES